MLRTRIKSISVDECSVKFVGSVSAVSCCISALGLLFYCCRH